MVAAPNTAAPVLVMSLVLVNAFKMVRGNTPLPDILAQIAEVIGRDNALKIARQYGGTRIFPPKNARRLAEMHPIIRLIGREESIKFCAHFFGEQILIPIGPFKRSVQQLYEFAKLRKNGNSVNKASHQLRIHGRTGTRWEALIRENQITDNDFAAYGKLIGDDWNQQ